MSACYNIRFHSLQSRRILNARVHICLVRFVNCRELGRGKIAQEEGPLCLNPLPVKHPIATQDGGIQNTVYRAFRSKITPALRANFNGTLFYTSYEKLRRHVGTAMCFTNFIIPCSCFSCSWKRYIWVIDQA